MKFLELTFAFPDFYLLMRSCHYLVHGLEVPAYIWDEQNIFLTFDFKTKIALYRIYIGLYIFLWRKYKNVFPVFPDFRTNRFRKTGCFQSGRILGPRGAQRHLKHGDWSSQSINSTLTLLLFIKDTGNKLGEMSPFRRQGEFQEKVLFFQFQFLIEYLFLFFR